MIPARPQWSGTGSFASTRGTVPSRAFLAQATAHGLDQFGRRGRQPVGEAEEGGDRRAALAQLEFGDEGAVQAALESQGFLAVALRIAAGPDLGREGSQKVGILMGAHMTTLPFVAFICTRMYGTKMTHGHGMQHHGVPPSSAGAAGLQPTDGWGGGAA